MRPTLAEYLDSAVTRGEFPAALADVIGDMAKACARISDIVRLGGIGDALGSAGSQNVQDEEQKKMDVASNDVMLEAFGNSTVVAGLASEEMETVVPTSAPAGTGQYLLLFDPLDGSSNIDVNVSVGTIFSVLPAPTHTSPLTEADFLQPGARQVAAGYAVYGPQTMLVLTVTTGVAGFTLDPQTGTWVLTHESLEVPQTTAEFAINMSNMRHWEAPIRTYIEECLAGVTGPRGKDFNKRWVASMVAEVHRILVRGGVFLYPWDKRMGSRAGKLRLMYEANPMSLLMERAGGQATDGRRAILELAPQELHQRVAIVLGSPSEVERIRFLHGEADKAA